MLIQTLYSRASLMCLSQTSTLCLMKALKDQPPSRCHCSQRNLQFVVAPAVVSRLCFLPCSLLPHRPKLHSRNQVSNPPARHQSRAWASQDKEAADHMDRSHHLQDLHPNHHPSHRHYSVSASLPSEPLGRYNTRNRQSIQQRPERQSRILSRPNRILASGHEVSCLLRCRTSLRPCLLEEGGIRHHRNP